MFAMVASLAVACGALLMPPEASASPVLLVKNPKKDRGKAIRVLVLGGEEEVNREFLEGLREFEFSVSVDVVDGKGNSKNLEQRLRDEFSPMNYDYICPFSTPLSRITLEWLRKLNLPHSPPIIFVASDPFRAGLVRSQKGDNGGNLSGVAASVPVEKQLGNARAFLTIEHLLVFVCTREQHCLGTFEAIEVWAREKNVALSRIDVANGEELRAQLASLGREPLPNGSAFYVPSSPLFAEHRKAIVECARSLKAPIIAEERRMIEAGALLGTTVDGRSVGRKAAEIAYINRISGVRMSAIPVQFPENSLSINGDTAKALGIEIDGAAIKPE
jgi:ABC-type uncharacterized transport system substrate-binding protein